MFQKKKNNQNGLQVLVEVSFWSIEEKRKLIEEMMRAVIARFLRSPSHNLSFSIIADPTEANKILEDL